MGITVYPITPDFVAEIGDVNLSKPLAEDEFEAIKEAFWKYAVLIFPDQNLDQEQHLEFAGKFGPLEAGTGIGRSGRPLRFRAELADVSNIDTDGQLLRDGDRLKEYQLGNRLWHTDDGAALSP